MPKAQAAGATIHYELNGEGPPLVLTMGQGSGPEARAPMLAALGEFRTVLSYDPRGTGRSDPANQHVPIETLAEDLLAVIDTAGIERADLVGLSTGTGTATAFAARHPERVRSLTLGAPWVWGDPELQILQNMRKAAARVMPPDHYTHFNSMLIYPPEYRRLHRDRLVAQAQTATLKPADPDALAARLDAILNYDARRDYPSIKAPTLVIGAVDDLVMPVWHARECAELIGGSRLVVFDGGGHLFAETRPKEFAAAVRDFVTQLADR
jgi:pimeloyl-ACP methyl ester carboxylesterase